MTQVATSLKPVAKPRNNIYTVLSLAAALALLAGTVFVAMKNMELADSPIAIVPVE